MQRKWLSKGLVAEKNMIKFPVDVPKPGQWLEKSEIGSVNCECFHN